MKRPNFLFILIDDLGARDLTAFGSTFHETPNLDRLAAEGLMFSNAYAAAPVCSPTRAAIMSGKYPARVGVTQYIGGKSEGLLAEVPYLHYLPLEEKSVASALREHDYQTWHVGKWHLGDEDFAPDKHGFDVNIGGAHLGHPRRGYFSPYNIPTLDDGREGEYLTDRLTEEAIRLLKNREKRRPFFLHLAHYAVHTPIQAPEALVEKYRRKSAAMGLDRVPAIVDGPYFSCLHKQELRIQRRLFQSDPTYAAMVENLDANIGRVLRVLEEECLTDDTFVVFTSDNGGLSSAEGSPTCNFPFAEGKGWNYEGGTRVCQIIRRPKFIAPGRVCSTPVTSTDFYPTFLEACGAPLLPEQHRDGVSLLPLLRGDGDLCREALFWHYPHYSNQGGLPASSIVCHDLKLIEFFETGKTVLFDLHRDVGERWDLTRECPADAERLHVRLKAWQREIAAAIPVPNPDYEKKSKRPKIPNNAAE
jgi:arylsulfatase A-like enzyme